MVSQTGSFLEIVFVLMLVSHRWRKILDHDYEHEHEITENP